MKRKPSWRVCPACKSRATKIINLHTGRVCCQICECEYAIDSEGNITVVKAANENYLPRCGARQEPVV